jgi:hypothetical protein
MFSIGSHQKCRSSFLFRRRAKSYDEAYFESSSKSAEEPENAGGLDMIKSDLKRLRDDPDEARREELDHGELARRGGAMAKSVLPG